MHVMPRSAAHGRAQRRAQVPGLDHGSVQAGSGVNCEPSP